MRDLRRNIRDFTTPIIIKNNVVSANEGEVTLDNKNNELNHVLDFNLNKDTSTNYDLMNAFGEIVFDRSLFINNNGSTNDSERLKIKIINHKSLKIILNDTLIEIRGKDYFVESIDKSAFDHEILYLILRTKV